MILSDMEVRYFGVTFKSCGCRFHVPALSDFSYGEFILHGRGVAGYLNSIAEPAWDDIASRLTAQALLPAKPSTEQIRCLQGVIARAADPIGGQPLYNHPVCPNCHSHDVDHNGSAGKFHRLPLALYTRYTALSVRDRDEFIAQLWLEVETRSVPVC